MEGNQPARIQTSEWDGGEDWSDLQLTCSSPFPRSGFEFFRLPRGGESSRERVNALGCYVGFLKQTGCAQEQREASASFLLFTLRAGLTFGSGA